MLHLPSRQTETTDPLTRELCRLATNCQTRRPDLRDRPTRALLLAAAGDVHQHPSITDGRLVACRRPGYHYLVRLDLGTCTCPDFLHQVAHPGPRLPACKHLLAAHLATLARELLARQRCQHAASDLAA